MDEDHIILRRSIEERMKLENSVKHLDRSIMELKKAIAEEGDADREYKKAIEENIVVLARYRARISALDSAIEDMHAGIVDVCGSIGVPTGDPSIQGLDTHKNLEMVSDEDDGGNQGVEIPTNATKAPSDKDEDGVFL